MKMDDDVVWLSDGAFQAMLEEKLRGRYLYLTANIVNHSSLGLVRCSAAHSSTARGIHLKREGRASLQT